MDSFSSSVIGSKSLFSPRSRQSIPTKRAISSTSFRKSLRLSVSGRSTLTGQVILKSQQNVVERFGQSLPVLITEALTFAERNTVVSARISSECGFAWLVCGRRLLIWQYKQSISQKQAGTPRRTGIANQCYELQLPQSDLAHRAELVSMFNSSNSSFPSCIAVSPEGVVRYWPSIAHEGISVEQQIDLQGQECDSLTSVEGLGCILATTTCTVVLVQSVETPRPSLIYHTLKMPSGWLGGISKRMSSFIFGPIVSDTSAETRIVRILGVPLDVISWHIYVLTGHSLQKWKLSKQESEEFLYAADLQRSIKAYFNKVWENNCRDPNDIESWILDIQPDTRGITLLTAAVNLQCSTQIEYALISVDTSEPTLEIYNFRVIKLDGLFRNENSADNLGYKLLLSGNTAYVYNHSSIAVFKSNENPDQLEFNTSQDFLLGGSICVNTPVFFSRNHGLVSVTPNDMDINASNMSIGTPLDLSLCDTSDNLTLYLFNPVELQAAYKDTLSQLKAAFLFHVKNGINERNETLRNTFDLNENYKPSIDTPLDQAIVAISNEILDDIPANDPRWANKTVGLGSSNSMQVTQQLEEKQMSHSLFVKFLHDVELWNNLGAVTVRGSTIRTAYVLAENGEKIAAAIALKAQPHDELLLKAISSATADSDISLQNGLTQQNIFYSQLNMFHKVLIELIQHCDSIAHSDMIPGGVALIIKTANDIILDVLKHVLNYRQSRRDFFEPHEARIAAEYLPWTAANGDDGLMDSLIIMQQLTYTYGAKAASDLDLQNTLYDDQLVSLVDIILDGRKSHLNSITENLSKNILLEQYASDRKRLIYPLINERRWEGAALLAEKYLDFECLVVICERSNNDERLLTYMERFQNEDFQTFVYNWFVKEDKKGKLIKLCSKHVNVVNPRSFLSTQPTLCWIQHTKDGKFQEAAETLKHLGEIETDSLTRQKTMYSFAKLASMAAESNNKHDLESINGHLDLISYQEELPDYVLQQYGYDTIKPSVIAPKDLIHLYTCNEYKDASELDFKKALDLLNFINDEGLRNELTLDIWKNAILRDNWNNLNLDSPLETLQTKLMFKVVDLALVLGADPSTLLPPIGVLLDHPDLALLQENKGFGYLMRSGYEHISKVLSSD